MRLNLVKHLRKTITERSFSHRDVVNLLSLFYPQICLVTRIYSYYYTVLCRSVKHLLEAIA